MIKQSKKGLVLVLAIVFVVLMFASCGGNAPATGGGSAPAPGSSAAAPGSSGGGSAPGTAPATIKIGIPNPTTGPLASFGIGTDWAEKLVVDYVNKDGGVFMKEYNKKIPLELYVVDTQSDSNKATEVTQQLITNNQVNLLLARHTPNTVLPVSQVAESNSMPCIALDCPIEAWQSGAPAGGYQWVYNSFWSVEKDAAPLYIDMWKQVGLGSGTKVGFLFPNDADGIAWRAVFEKQAPAAGYVITDPGDYPIGNTDWTAIINKFKAAGVEIICGNDITPDVVSFMNAAAQQKLSYKLVTIGRGVLFPTDANAMAPEIADGLTSEVWWSPWHPWSSSLTGMTCPELAKAYEQSTGQGWSAPMGYKYAGMEIAVDVLTRAGSLDPTAIRDAIGATDLDTMVGHIKYDPTTHVAPTPIVGGQWKLNADKSAVELRIVNNNAHPNIPTNGTITLPASGDGPMPAAPF